MTTRDEIIGMARESSMEEINDVLFYASDDNLAKFAALVIAQDRARLAAGVELPEVLHHPEPHTYAWTNLEKEWIANFAKDYGDRRAAAAIESCNRDTNAAWKLMCEKMVQAEREACADVAKAISDKYAFGYYGNEVDTADEIEAAIRARGQ